MSREDWGDMAKFFVAIACAYQAFGAWGMLTMAAMMLLLLDNQG